MAGSVNTLTIILKRHCIANRSENPLFSRIIQRLRCNHDGSISNPWQCPRERRRYLVQSRWMRFGQNARRNAPWSCSSSDRCKVCPLSAQQKGTKRRYRKIRGFLAFNVCRFHRVRAFLIMDFFWSKWISTGAGNDIVSGSDCNLPISGDESCSLIMSLVVCCVEFQIMRSLINSTALTNESDANDTLNIQRGVLTSFLGLNIIVDWLSHRNITGK